MERPGRRRAAYRATFTLALLVGLATACGREPPPTEFGLREEIPLGLLTVQVTRLERVQKSRTDPNLLITDPEDRAWALHVHWRGAAEIREPLDRRQYVESVLDDRFTLVDADGARYEPLGSMTRQQFQANDPFTPLSPDWVVIFHVPEVVDALTVRIENPDPGAGGYRVGIVRPGD